MHVVLIEPHRQVGFVIRRCFMRTSYNHSPRPGSSHVAIGRDCFALHDHVGSSPFTHWLCGWRIPIRREIEISSQRTLRKHQQHGCNRYRDNCFHP
uniref:Uncharacterized protein n=1 Tax=Aeromonas hydrophila TaxID=644 RepID=Q6TFA1_AERHY|nr:unknown [Aeromonas hydrophila]AAR06619.1 unknown [Aeromonas hydrophila]AAS46723.1 unknown [Aeromonas hydrophila]